MTASLAPRPSILVPQLLVPSYLVPLSGTITSIVVEGVVLHDGDCNSPCQGRSVNARRRSKEVDDPTARYVPRCRRCIAGSSPEYHCYLSVLVDGADGEHVLARLGHEAIDPLADFYDVRHSLRGARLRAFVGHRGITVARPDKSRVIELPEPLDVPLILGWTADRNRKDQD